MTLGLPSPYNNYYNYGDLLRDVIKRGDSGEIAYVLTLFKERKRRPDTMNELKTLIDNRDFANAEYAIRELGATLFTDDCYPYSSSERSYLASEYTDDLVKNEDILLFLIRMAKLGSK